MNHAGGAAASLVGPDVAPGVRARLEENIPYDESLNLELRNLYYRSALYFIERISGPRTQSEFPDYFAYNIPYPFVAARQILVHRAIAEQSWNNVEWLAPIEHKEGRDDEFYIDVDGIGLTNRSTRTR